jgi:hypothetical protein
LVWLNALPAKLLQVCEAVGLFKTLEALEATLFDVWFLFAIFFLLSLKFVYIFRHYNNTTCCYDEIKT